MDASIRVLVVDDSYFMRRVISEMLEFDPQLNVIGTASNGAQALEKIKSQRPDVVTLDIDMPGMDGMSVIRHIMIQCPVPIVVFSSLFCYGDVTFEALQLGVVDFVPKPSGMQFDDKDKMHNMIIDRVKNASRVNLDNIRRANIRPRRLLPQLCSKTPKTALKKLIAMGAGLSGTNSVIRVVGQLSPSFPGAIAAMLELSPQIIPAFVKKFNTRVPWEIACVEDGRPIERGICYLGSREHVTSIVRDHNGAPCFKVNGKVAEPLNVLFKSSAGIFENDAIGVLMTGLGDDGAEGFAAIQQHNGLTIAQHTNCCVFPNLTQNAIAHGAVSQVVDESLLHAAIENRAAPRVAESLQQPTYVLAQRFKLQAIALQTTAKYSTSSENFQKYISNLLTAVLSR